MSEHEIKDSLLSVETFVSYMPETNKTPSGIEDIKHTEIFTTHTPTHRYSRRLTKLQIVFAKSDHLQLRKLKKAPWTGKILSMKIAYNRLNTAVRAESQPPTPHGKDSNYLCGLLTCEMFDNVLKKHPFLISLFNLFVFRASICSQEPGLTAQ